MLFFAKSPELLVGMKEDYKEFVADYRDAAERLLAAQEIGGSFDPKSEFPYGCFPPALQFTGPSLLPPPPRPPSRLLEYDEKEQNIISRGEIPVIRVPRESAFPAIETSEPYHVDQEYDPPSMRPT